MRELSTNILDKLKGINDRYIEISDMLSFEEVLADSRLTIRLSTEKKKIEDIATKYQKYLRCRADLNLIEEDDDFDKNDEYLSTELTAIRNELDSICLELTELLANLDKEYNSIIIEIAGSGKNSFVKDIVTSYINFCQRMKLNHSCDDRLDNNVKNVTIFVSGSNAFDLFYNENGVHEFIKNKSSDIVCIAVYKNPENHNIEFDEKDLKVESYRSSGAGGQNINKVSTAIRITHMPTGIVVTCQDERSQFQNKEKAIKNIEKKVKEFYLSQYKTELQKEKKSIVKLKTNKVRSYNYDSNVVSDMNLNMSITANQFLSGEMEDILFTLSIRG